MNVVGRLKAVLGLNDSKFRKGLSRAQKKTRLFGKTAKKVGGMIAGALSFTAVIAGTKKLITTFASFSQQTSRLSAITGKTKEQISDLTEQAKLLGSTTQKSASQVAGLQVELAKKGFSTGQISAATEGIVNLSIAAGEDLPQAADIASGVMNAFGMEAEEMGRISDVMAASFTQTALDLNKFQYGMSKVAPVAKQVGMSIERTTGFLGTLIDANVDASTASAQLRNILITVKEEGISLSQAFDRIKNAQEPVTVATELFGKRAGPIASILANNTEKVDQLTKSFNNAEGAAKKMADTMQDNLQGDLDAARSAIEGLFIAAGDSQNSGLRGAVQGITESIRGASENIGVWISKAIKWIKIIGKTAGAFIAAKLAIGAYLTITKAARIAMIAYQGAAKAARIAQIALNTAMKANPIGLVITAITALAGVFVTAWKRSEKFRNFFKKLWIRIKQYSAAAWDAVSTYFGSIGDVLRTIGKAIGQVFKGQFKKAKETIVKGFGGIVDDFANVGKEAKEKAEKEIAKLEGSAKNIGQKVDAEFAAGLVKDAKAEAAAEKKGKKTGEAFSKGVNQGLAAPKGLGEKAEATSMTPFETETVEPQLANMDHIIKKTQKMQQEFAAGQQQGSMFGGVLMRAFEGMSNSITEALNNSKNVLQGFWQFFKDFIKGLITKLVAAAAAAALLAALLAVTTGGGSLIGSAATGFGEIFKAGFGQLSGFGMQAGGVVPSGYPNDSYPAMLTSGETVTPPDKLPGSGKIEVTGRLIGRGDDLEAIITEAQRKKGNTL